MPTLTPLLQAPQIADRIKGCCQPVASPIDDAKADDLAAIYRALADPTRIQMIHILAAAPEPVCVCDFTAAFDLGQPTISHHLARLREASIVDSHAKGSGPFID